LLSDVLFQRIDAHALSLLSGTLRTYQRAGCDDEVVTLKCPHGTSISVQVAQYGKSAPSKALSVHSLSHNNKDKTIGFEVQNHPLCTHTHTPPASRAHTRFDRQPSGINILSDNSVASHNQPLSDNSGRTADQTRNDSFQQSECQCAFTATGFGTISGRDATGSIGPELLGEAAGASSTITIACSMIFKKRIKTNNINVISLYYNNFE
ncbi:hypothetical protein L9F63_019841, partial [Diploptera punctata]